MRRLRPLALKTRRIWGAALENPARGKSDILVEEVEDHKLHKLCTCGLVRPGSGIPTTHTDIMVWVCQQHDIYGTLGKLDLR